MSDTFQPAIRADVPQQNPQSEPCAPIPCQQDKIRQITIEEVNRGFIVRVGCHTFAISTKAELTTKLTEYINDPEKTEKKWYAGNLF